MLHASATQTCNEETAKADNGIPTKLLTYREAADVLKVSMRTIFALVKDGHLPAFRLRPARVIKQKRSGKVVKVIRGGAVRIDSRDLEQFIQEAKVVTPVKE